jgi:hypothetical protein
MSRYPAPHAPLAFASKVQSKPGPASLVHASGHKRDVLQWLQDGNTLLHIAAKSGSVDVMTTLYLAGADASLVNKVWIGVHSSQLPP